MPRRAVVIRDTLEPPVTAVEYAGSGYRLRLAFEDGLRAEVDLEPLLRPFEASPVFAPLLRDRALFAAVHLGGGTASWPNGADVAPETLYHLAAAAAGRAAQVSAAAAETVESLRAGVARLGDAFDLARDEGRDADRAFCEALVDELVRVLWKAERLRDRHQRASGAGERG